MEFVNILNNIWKLYLFSLKNIIHWTLARLIILLFASLLAIFAFAPFLILGALLAYVDPIAWGDIFFGIQSGTELLMLLGAFSENPVYFLSQAFIILLGLMCMIAVFSYKSILLYRLFAKYEKGEKAPFKEIFSLEKFPLFCKTIPKIVAWLAAPVLVYIAFFFVMVFVYGGFMNLSDAVQSSLLNPASIIMGSVFILASLWFFYLKIRLLFVYNLIIDEEEGARELLIEKSFKMTPMKRVLQCIILFIVFGFFVGIPTQIENYHKEKSDEIGKYLYFKNLESFPEEVLSSLNVNQKSKEDIKNDPEYAFLSMKYSSTTDEALKMKQQSLLMRGNILFLLNFIFLYTMYELWIFVMYRFYAKKDGPLISKVTQKISRKKPKLEL